jgi:large subunit ribosomal protein L13
MKIIDATNLVLGRMATEVAKQAMLGEQIAVVNCEKAIVTGTKPRILATYKPRRERGYALKGPFYPRMPDRIVRRTIRGMLPYKQYRGKIAYKNVMCYIGIPKELKDKKLETIKGASSEGLTCKFMKLKELSRLLGSKV